MLASVAVYGAHHEQSGPVDEIRAPALGLPAERAFQSTPPAHFSYVARTFAAQVLQDFYVPQR
jgi:hypothetical protein